MKINKPAVRRAVLTVSFSITIVLVLSFMFPRAPILSSISGWDEGKVCRLDP